MKPELFELKVLFICVITTLCAGCILPPGQPETGYGSKENYICTPVSVDEAITIGDNKEGSEVWIFSPDKLKNGNSAPVVIYLHGFMAITPVVYQGHIDHLVKQGIIVIFPQFNLTGASGVLEDMDQNLMLERAVNGVNQAISLPEIATIIEPDNITLVSHSVGGILSLCWAHGGGIPVQSMVLLHPNTSTEAIPDMVTTMFDIVELDFKEMAPSTTCPVMIIGGGGDDIARPEHVQDAFDSLTNASPRIYYQVKTDSHGFPILSADHLGPLQFNGMIPLNIRMHSGYSIGEDAFDFRVYYAAVDAAIAGDYMVDFDMGKWSDDVDAVSVVVVDEDS